MSIVNVYMLFHRRPWNYEGVDVQDSKLLGVFSSKEIAEKTIKKYILLPGFCDYPDDFSIETYEVDIYHEA